MADLAQQPDPGTDQGGMLASPGPEQPDPSAADSGPPPQKPSSPWPNLPSGPGPFVFPAGRRHHSQWGEPDFIMRGAQNYPGVAPGPWMPQLSDVNRLVWQVTQNLMHNGSTPVAALAGQMGNARGMYTKEFMAGRRAAQQLHYEEYEQARKQLIDRQTDELKKYAGIYSVYGKDPDELSQHLMELAHEFNDPELIRVLNGKGVQAAEELLNSRNNVNDVMMKVQQQADRHEEAGARTVLDQAKTKHQMDLDAVYKSLGYSGADDPRLQGVGGAGAETPPAPGTEPAPDGSTDPQAGAKDPSGNAPAPTVSLDDISPEDRQAVQQGQADDQAAGPSVDASGAEPMALQPGQQPPQPGQDGFPALPGGQQPPTQGEAAPVEEGAPAPAQQAQAAMPAAPGRQPAPPIGASRDWRPPPPAAPAAAAPATPAASQAPQRVQEMAHGVLNGQPLPPGTLPIIRNIVNGEVADMDGKLDRILSDPKIQGKEAVRAAVAQVDPRMAYTMDRLLNGTQAPPSSWSQRGRPWQTVLSLASKADPTFNQNTYATRAKTLASFTSGADGKNVTSIGTAYQHLLELRQEIQSRPDLWKMVLGGNRVTEGLVSPEDQAKVGALINNARTAADEYERAVIGGKPALTAQMKSERELDPTYTSSGALMGNIDNKIKLLQDRLNTLRGRFAEGTGLPGAAMDGLYKTYAAKLPPNDEANKETIESVDRLRALSTWKPGSAPMAQPATTNPPAGATDPPAGETHPAPPGVNEGDFRWDKRTGKKYQMRGGVMVPVS